MKKKLLWALAILLPILLGAPLLLFLLLPHFIEPFVKTKLAEFGCENARVEVSKISKDLAQIKEVYCLLPGRGEFRFSDLEFSYALKRLYSGNLGKILVKKAEIKIFPSNEAEKEKLKAIWLPEKFFALVPVSELEVSKIEAEFPGEKGKLVKGEGQAAVRFGPLSISGELEAKVANPEVDVMLEFSLSESEALLHWERGVIEHPMARIEIPKGSKHQLNRVSDFLVFQSSSEVEISPSDKRIKERVRIKGLKAEFHEKSVKAEFLLGYGALSSIPLALNWSLEKEEMEFELKQTKIDLSKLYSLAAPYAEKFKLKVDAGNLRIEAKGRAPLKDPMSFSAEIEGGLEGAGGNYGESLIKGLSFPLRLSAKNGSVRIQPADLKIQEFNSGFPVKNIQAKVGLEGKPSAMNLILAGAEAEVFSGKVLVPELLINSKKLETKFDVKLRGLNLGEIVALQKQENMSATGLVDGNLPIQLRKDGIVVEKGRIHARPPGGHISYQAGEGLSGAADGNPGLKLAVDVLRNFHYKILGGEVNYQPSGDMSIALRLEGHNPDWQSGRPVHFNFTVTENLLKLLKSLRIAEDTGNALEEGLRGE